MTTNPNNVSHPGFQKSETSSAEVTIYSQSGDPVIYRSEGMQELIGRHREDPNHSLISVTTNKSLEGTGTFVITLKPAQGAKLTPFDQFVDDDWVDIVFTRHGRRWHTMRGLIDRIERTKTVAGNGATSTTYTITGRDFQKVWEQTPIWFNRFTLENVEGAWAYKVYSNIPNLGGNPAKLVQAFLIGWLQQFGGVGRANWDMPKMPNSAGNFLVDIAGANADINFTGVTLQNFNTDGFTNYPPRYAIDPSLMSPSGTLWTLAKEWSDPAFCELFCDLGKQGTQLLPDEEVDLTDGTMCVFFRDRPFPMTSSVVDDEYNKADALGLNKDSAWFALPTHTISRQEIQQDIVGREGTERMNAFFVSPQLQQELVAAGGVELMQPLWNKEDIRKHGFRRYDVYSHYKTQNGKLLTLSTVQRYMLQNWYAMNPYLLSGTINLGHGRPEIRIGTRIRIPGDTGDNNRDETYYVEGVSNSWKFGVGIRTALTVTRGFIGTDNQLLQEIDFAVQPYDIPHLKASSPNISA